ncbi:MAG TPA: zinc-ribbon domain-containing protein [Candidatus Deferrimicrobium sp.]|nr:zinc-ribbon domain-containing protein [Candidatus Deferrimicrobium sp.]
MNKGDSYEQRVERRMKSSRRYEGSSDYLGAFGLASVFTFVGILAIFFLIFHIDFIGLRTWGYYLFIPAFFIWIGGISSYFRQKRLRAEVLAVLENYQSGPLNIENLAEELMMERPSLLRLLIDLRVERLIKFRIDSKSGELIIGESFTPPTVETNIPSMPPINTIFCPQCGVRISAESMFCPNCGSSIQ